MQAFFTQPKNQEVVQQSMATLIGAMKAYDSDKSMRLSRAEADSLFRDQFSAHYSNYERAITDLNPQVPFQWLKAERPPLDEHCTIADPRSPSIGDLRISIDLRLSLPPALLQI